MYISNKNENKIVAAIEVVSRWKKTEVKKLEELDKLKNQYLADRRRTVSGTRYRAFSSHFEKINNEKLVNPDPGYPGGTRRKWN
jgi:hypothetical protein